MEPTTIVAMIAAVSGIILGWIGRTRSFKQEVAQEASGGAVLRTDMDYIKRGIDDVRLEQRSHGQRFDIMSERVTRIEESSKQAHKRLDRLEHE